MRKTVILIVVVSFCFMLVALPCSAGVDFSDYSLGHSMINPLPINTYFKRTNGNTYYYEPQNIIGDRHVFNNDGNLKYKVNRYATIDNTPFELYNYKGVTEALSVGTYRLDTSNQTFTCGYSVQPGYFDNILALAFLPDLFCYNNTFQSELPYVQLKFTVSYINPEGDYETISVNYLNHIMYLYGTDGDLYINYGNVWNIVLDYLEDRDSLNYVTKFDYLTTHPVFLEHFSATILGYHSGAGYFTWYGDYSPVLFAKYKDIEYIHSEFTMYDALEPVKITFRGVYDALNVEILPTLTIWKILVVACAVPIVIKVIKAV